MKNEKEKKRFIKNIGIVGVIAGIIWLFILAFREIDIGASDYFGSHQNAIGIKLMRLVSSAGSNASLVTLIIGIFSIFYFLGKKKEGIFYFLTAISGVVLELMLKEIIGTLRPVNPFETSFSFPSGHTFMAFIMVGAIAYIFWPKYKKTIFYLFGFSGVVMFSRIYLNVHWPSDIFGSIALGCAWLILCIKLFETTFSSYSKP